LTWRSSIHSTFNLDYLPRNQSDHPPNTSLKHVSDVCPTAHQLVANGESLNFLRLLLGEANDTALKAILLTFGHNSSSGKGKIAVFRPAERVLDSLEAPKQDPHHWRHYEVTTGLEFFGQEVFIL
jgi:hypothetical protein